MYTVKVALEISRSHVEAENQTFNNNIMVTKEFSVE